MVGTRPHARRRPGNQAALTRAQIIDVAEALARREGLHRLSARRLGAELSVTPGTLYWHLDNKQQLLELVLDRAWESIERPGLETGTWLERLVAFYGSVREVLLRYPGIGTTLMTVAPTERSLAACYFVFELLMDGGFDEDAAVSVFIALSTFAIGHLAMVDTAHRTPRTRGAGPFRPDAVELRPYLEDRPQFAPFVRNLVGFDDQRSRSKFLSGVELLVRGAAADAGIPVPERWKDR